VAKASKQITVVSDDTITTCDSAVHSSFM